MQVFARMRRFYMPYALWGIGSVLAMAALTAVGLIRPWLLQQLIDRVIKEQRFDELPYWVFGVVAVALVRGVLNYSRQYLGHVFGQNATLDLRNALYDKLQYLHFTFYDNAHTGDLMSRVTADVEAFRMFLSFGFVHLMDVFFMTIFSLVVMLAMNVKLTLVTLASMPLLLVVVLRFERQVHPAFTRVREALAALSTATQENLYGIRTVKAFARESFEVQKFSAHNEEYLKANLFTAGLWARYFPAIEMLSNLALTLILAYGGLLVLRGELTLGELVAFNSLIWYWIWPMREVGYRINELTQAVAAGERLLEVLDHPVAVQSPRAAVRLPEMKGHVRFEHVTFRYQSPRPDTREVTDHPALVDINLDAPPGSVIGLIGATGSGKSTLVSLIPRFYDVTEGRVTVDGVDVRDLDLADLRRQIGIVLQETFLWSASIKENIAYGRRTATMEEIVAAAKLAQAHDFIMETPNGYDTIVGERGMGLSGGQKQRIAIARAILNNPRILILDDATASVDMETEHEIQVALRNAMKGRTTFIIAHRISSLKHADEILVLDQGCVVERGTHEELLARGGIYRAIYDIQFRDYEEQRARRAHGNGGCC
ncbi:MAG: ABC transporter ATP-binding protein [Symbiobacterium sp.]|uniref:ABC transporter ATP-binding protein n=1 Tax=Symbiobacterium sp. TaxID=1971213 RepID=UPI0034648170